MVLSWKSLDPNIEQVIHTAQVPWIGTRYSAHQRKVGCGINCYSLVSCILDDLYRTGPNVPPQVNVNAGACGDKGHELVLWFRRTYPLDEVTDTLEPGDLVVTRSVAGNQGPDWEGHVMMAGMKTGHAIHALPSTGVSWGSFATNLGRVLKVYRPRDKASWCREGM